MFYFIKNKSWIQNSSNLIIPITIFSLLFLFFLIQLTIYNDQLSNGETLAGNGAPENLTLNFPTDVVLDADGYLYIGDDHNGRIIRSGHGEWQCIIGCSGSKGSARIN